VKRLAQPNMAYSQADGESESPQIWTIVHDTICSLAVMRMDITAIYRSTFTSHYAVLEAT